MLAWLRRSFAAGFVITVPLAVSVFALVWLFQLVDGLMRGPVERLFDRPIPGVGVAVTVAGILLIGTLATNVFGRRILGRGEGLLLHVPVFRTIYAPVKQLIEAFSPGNQFGFKRVVMVEDPVRGFVLGFLTKEFVVDRGQGPETLLAVYVPTNHLYLGDVIVCPRERAAYPELTVEQGVRVFLTGGMALPAHMRADRHRSGPASREES
ncbi:MAG TPA: DUF502 domain-containing protein [Vicinamibacterales bacterium]|nr:DUF502 domain-containing protein [Vicinamibacterales bacterium]